MSDVAKFPDDSIDPFRQILSDAGGKLTDQQLSDLANKLADGRISTIQLQSLLKLAPSLIAPIANFLQFAPQLSKEIAASESDARAHNRHVFDQHVSVIRELMQRATTDEAYLGIAEHITAAAKMSHESNEKISADATDARKGLFGAIVGGLGVAATIALTVARLAR